jgi:hypothetical protein
LPVRLDHITSRRLLPLRMMHGADQTFGCDPNVIGERDERRSKDLSGLPGGNSEREPPDPIPNSEVKTFCADGSVAASHARVGHCQVSHAKAPMLVRASGPFFFVPSIFNGSTESSPEL